MRASFTPVLLGDKPVASLDHYLADGGGEGIAIARRMGSDATIEELLASGLRGRGGAGFPTGQKWATIAASEGSTRYVVCNGAEGEPATFKDRALMRANPWQLVEGVAIAALTLGAREAFIALKARFELERERVTEAVEEMQRAGLVGDIPITIVAGPDEYLFGEEKALLEVIEGNAPLPRLLPPFLHGLFATAPQLGWQSHEPEVGSGPRAQSNPTLVNNAETMSTVPHILSRGAEWYRSMGTVQSPGSVVATVVGDTVSAGVAEIELGTPLREVIDVVGGGLPPGRRVQAVFSGIANPVLTPDLLDTPVSYEGMQAVGSGMGAVGFAVYDDTACMVEVARAYSRFLYVESCNQCPACKSGCAEITTRLERIEAGAGTDLDVQTVGARLRNVTDANRCYLGEQEQRVVSSVLRSFSEDFAAHLEGRGCPSPRPIVVPKLVDLTGGVAVYDTRQLRKQPDWTFAGEPGSGE